MEKILHDVLNAGIALFRAGEGSIGNAVSEVQRTYDTLKEKGATDTSEAAVAMRKTLDDVVTQVNGLSTQAGSAYNDSLVQLQTQYQTLMDQIQSMVPQDQIDQIKDKIEELSAAIKEKVGGGSGGSAPAQ